jgi:hypothetical protein
MYIKLFGSQMLTVTQSNKADFADYVSFFVKPDVNKIYSFFANIHPTIRSGGFCYGRIFSKLRNIIGKGF